MKPMSEDYWRAKCARCGGIFLNRDLRRRHCFQCDKPKRDKPRKGVGT